jgi:hypothetical protein
MILQPECAGTNHPLFKLRYSFYVISCYCAFIYIPIRKQVSLQLGNYNKREFYINVFGLPFISRFFFSSNGYKNKELVIAIVSLDNMSVWRYTFTPKQTKTTRESWRFSLVELLNTTWVRAHSFAFSGDGEAYIPPIGAEASFPWGKVAGLRTWRRRHDPFRMHCVLNERQAIADV